MQPIANDVNDVSIEEQIDIICDEFKGRWLQGTTPNIGEYLKAAPSHVDNSTLFLELLLVEIECRHSRRDKPTPDEYLAKYPEFAKVIEAVDFDTDRHPSATAKLRSPGATSIPKRIAHFEVLEYLGGGANGRVWKARDTRLEREVALKIPKRALVSGEELHRFFREGRAAAQLHHPSIVSVHEVGHFAGISFIVSDYIAGMDLAEWLKANSVSPRNAAELCLKLAFALEHAHRQGVIHRDFKPGNVLIDTAEEPHVADFGLAKWDDDDEGYTVDGQPLGTPAYMSPEQARGDAARVDCRTDVYALGVVLYEMLTGQRPFTGDRAVTMDAVIRDQPPAPRRLNKSIPRDLETICLKAMEKEPNRRYASAAVLADDLQRYLQGRSIAARRTGPLVAAWRWTRRHPARAIAMLLATATMFSLGIAWTLAQQKHAMLGIRPVAIATNPPGARVWLAPLDEVTGEPLDDQVMSVARRTPVTVDLKPGDYFVVAVLDGGRFHEVFRRVPHVRATLPGTYAFQHWESRNANKIELPVINIPLEDVVQSMASVKGERQFRIANRAAPSAPSRVVAVDDFYIDCEEYSIGRAHADDPIRRLSAVNRNRPSDSAVRASYYEAMHWMEMAGKRLPFDHEFEYAAKMRDDDAVTSKTIKGLVSNAAEWTSTKAHLRLPAVDAEADRASDLPIPDASDCRIVHGGDEDTFVGAVVMESRGGLGGKSLAIRPSFRQVGMRGVRSVHPRYASAP